MCLSVTTKSAAYLIFITRAYPVGVKGAQANSYNLLISNKELLLAKANNKLLYGVFKDFVMWLLLKMLCSLSSGIICSSLPPSSLPGELLMDKQDSDGYFLIQIVCMVSNRSNKTTGSLLIIAHLQRSIRV